ncbi:hypothetical protein HanRHA438_Chr01g0008891 [Helianthus annuus]|nr:hypothetical protein HanRHA438_Chr01g0008891 [Helianthus annuus]
MIGEAATGGGSEGTTRKPTSDAAHSRRQRRTVGAPVHALSHGSLCPFIP